MLNDNTRVAKEKYLNTVQPRQHRTPSFPSLGVSLTTTRQGDIWLALLTSRG